MRQLIVRAATRLGYRIVRADDTGHWMDRARFNSIAYEAIPQEKLEKRAFYNVGAGRFRHPYWTNIDMPSEWYGRVKGEAAISYDLESLAPVPVDTDVAEAVYTSHTIEHISDAAAENLFREVRRILAPNRVFRITCPDIDLAHEAWRRGDRLFFYWIDNYSRPDEMRRTGLRYPMNRASLDQVFLRMFASSASDLHRAEGAMTDAEIRDSFNRMGFEEALDHCVSRCEPALQKTNPGWHINWWNFGKLERMLTAAGFKTVMRSGYGQSKCPAMRDTSLFDNTHPKMSIYLDAY